MNNSNKELNMKRVTAVVAVVMLIYFAFAIVKLVKDPTDTFLVEEGKLYNEESATGYVIRDESVIQGNNYKNGMLKIKAEGERVSKNEPVFRYYSNNEHNLQNKIQELDIKIQEAMDQQTDLFSNDMKLIEKQIEQKLSEVTGTYDIKKLTEYKKDINSNITKKAKIAGELSPAGSHIKKLIEERSSYENQLNSGAEYVNAQSSGIVSYRVDGLENILTKESFNTLNTKLLEDLRLKTGEIVASNEESAKVINNFECYIAVTLKSEEAMGKSVGDSVKIRLSNNKEISAKIDYIVEEDEKRLVIFKIEDNVEELCNYRKISLDVIWWSYTGLKVPNSAIIKENGLNYIMRTRAGYLDKILVKVLKQNSTYSIIGRYENSELTELGFDSARNKANENSNII